MLENRGLSNCGTARVKTNAKQNPWPCYLEIVALLLILALAAYLRLANRADNPGWYTDEGTHLDIAQNLLCGHIQYLAINQSTLLFAKLPLFELALAGLLRASGGGIGTLRAFTGFLGVASVGLLYWVARRTQGKDTTLALLAALMLAIYPQAVLYSRFGFSYNLLTPLVLLTLLGLWEYLNATPARRGWLALASLAIGAGTVSDLWMFALVAPLAVVILRRRWRDLLWSLPLLALPFGLYAAIMLVKAPQPFLFDLRFTLFRLGKLSLPAQMQTLALNYATLVFQDAWIALAIVGLFLLRPARLRRLSLLTFLLPIVILGRTTALFSLGFYYVVPLLPFVGLGVAAVIRRGVPYASQTVRGALRPLLRGKCLTIGANLILLLIVAAPFATSLVLTVGQVRDGFRTEIDPFLLNPDHARQVAGFVNAHTTHDDVVIASPSLAWLLQANTADVQMSIAATGQGTPDMPADIPTDRFAFNPRYTQARFVVVDNLWRNWATWNVPGMPEMLQQVETWPMVFQAGEIEVYGNPNR